MLKFYKMTSCLRGINSCICTDKRQLSLRQTSYQIHNLLNMLQTSTFLPSAKHFPYSRQSEVTRNCGSCWQPICFSQILDFTPISVSNFFFPMRPTSVEDRKHDLEKNSYFNCGRGMPSHSLLTLHVQLCGPILEADVDQVASKCISNFLKVENEKRCE